MLIFCVINVILYVFSFACGYETMSGITVNDLGEILEEKLASLQKRLDETFESLSFISQQYEEIVKKLAIYDEERKGLVNENKSLKAELRDTTKKLNDLTEKCDELEQYLRRECVEIRSIPLPAHQQSENTDQIAIKVAGLMGLEVKDEDLSVSHRLKTSQTCHGKNAQAPPIIVKFARRITREQFYRTKKKLQGVSTKDLGYTTNQKIFITESLTQKNKTLFNEATRSKWKKNSSLSGLCMGKSS